MDKFISDNRIHEGHRARMRAKLSAHGPDIFDTYELLEMLLYYSVPYKDTNPISKRLLYRFGSLDGVLRADIDELTEVDGVGRTTAELIKTVGEASGLLGGAIYTDTRRVFHKFMDAGKFFVNYFSDIKDYRVALLLLDNGMRMLDAVTLYNVDYEYAAIKPESFINMAIRSRAASVITAHFHPNGPLYPTQGDRATNSLITDTLKSVGVVHLEHFLVSGEKFMGIMDHTKDRFLSYSGIYSFLLSKEEAIESGAVLPTPEDYIVRSADSFNPGSLRKSKYK